MAFGPRWIDVKAIEVALSGVPTVRGVHNLHVWPLSTTVAALTALVEHDGTRDTAQLLQALQELLAHRFGVRHATIQFELRGCGRGC